MKRKSWKTTLGGSLAGFGVFLVGVPTALGVIGHPLPGKFVDALVTIGLLIQGLGVFFTGLFGRDNDKTSEDVGVDEGTKLRKRLECEPVAPKNP